MGYAQTFKLFYAYLSEKGMTDANKMSKDIIYSYINNIGDKVKPTTINHNLRNIRAILYWGMGNVEVWIVNGGDVSKLQKLLGHSTLEMT